MLILWGLIATLKNKLFDSLIFILYNSKMDKKDVIIKLNQLRNYLHDRQCWVSDWLIELKEILSDAWIEQKFDLDNYLTYQELEDRIKDEVDSWIERLYYFLNWINLHNLEVVKLDNYWNCDCRISYQDLVEFIDEVIDEVEWMQDEDFE